MLRFRLPSLFATLLVPLLLALPTGIASSQATPTGTAPTLSKAELQQLATVHVALLKLQDSLNAEMAHPRNKTREGQERLQVALRTHFSALVEKFGLSADEFQRRRFAVSTSDTLRVAFEDVVAEITGGPARGGQRTMATLSGTPSAPPAATAAAATAATGAQAATPRTERAARTAAEPAAASAELVLPPGAVGTHVGHILVRFPTTPDKVGLLTIAHTEAQVAAQHAALAARTPTNLQAMQTHAGHVIHALDPEVVTSGPGKGYGLKKAAAGVASHVDLAAKSEGATAGVRTHAEHVAAAANSTVERADQIIALAERIRAAKDAAEAAALVGQMASLCEQLTTGADLDADGRVNWGGGEGGLQQADAHMQLLLKASNQ